MRKIKFRAIIAPGTIVYFDLVNILDDKFSNRELLWPWLEQGNIPDRFTGAYDKHGEEIYGGDIVKTPGIDNKQVVRYEEIMLSDDMTAPGIGFQFNEEPSRMEIIGDVHENPELLEKK